MNIAVFFNANPSSGGAFQDQWNILNALKQNKKHKLLVITGNNEIAKVFKDNFKVINISWITDKMRFMRAKKKKNQTIENVDYREISNVVLKEKWKKFKKNKRRTVFDKVFHKILELYLKSKKIDLILWPGPMENSFKINIPYIIKIYDLGHKLIPQFPEMSAFGEYERREYLHENGIKNAAAIIVDSEQGKKDLVNHYNAEKEKIFPLMHLPPNYLKFNISNEVIEKVTKKYNLPKEYVYYPAQFWPHKNHILILKAISFLKEKGIKINAVFSGSDKSEWGVSSKLKKYAEKQGISDLVHYVGYVSNEEVNVLYKKSKALVMATFLGPSNIPYFEAFKLGVPVIATNILGLKTQVKDAAIMINPEKPEELARAIQRILEDKKKVKKMISKGKKILDNWTEKDFRKQLFKIIDYAEQKI
jgi:glycosyltransferase involved in cell wall biosynthesis